MRLQTDHQGMLVLPNSLLTTSKDTTHPRVTAITSSSSQTCARWRSGTCGRASRPCSHCTNHRRRPCETRHGAGTSAHDCDHVRRGLLSRHGRSAACSEVGRPFWGRQNQRAGEGGGGKGKKKANRTNRCCVPREVIGFSGGLAGLVGAREGRRSGDGGRPCAPLAHPNSSYSPRGLEKKTPLICFKGTGHLRFSRASSNKRHQHSQRAESFQNDPRLSIHLLTPLPLRRGVGFSVRFQKIKAKKNHHPPPSNPSAARLIPDSAATFLPRRGLLPLRMLSQDTQLAPASQPPDAAASSRSTRHRAPSEAVNYSTLSYCSQ